ncbi:MAG: tetratricopeptide repeat protein [Methanothrix sp.]|nr:tetratricopeptide repeat protein [Methanothrix sp.]
MKLHLTILFLLMAISTCYALSLNENIDVYGRGGLYASTNSMNAKDSLNSIGEQSYVRSMDMGKESDYFESQYKCTNGTPRNNNSSNYYYILGKSPGETEHFITVWFNQSLESSASVANNDDVFVTEYKIKSNDAKLSETLSTVEGPNTIIRAESKVDGNLSLSSSASENEERWDGYSLDGEVLKLNSVKMSGERGVRDRATKSPELILEGGYQISPQEEAANLTREGNRLAENGDYASAIIYYDSALKLDKDSKSSAVTYNEKGVALNYLGRYAEAEEAYSEALRRSPNYRIAMINSAGNQIDLGKADDALNVLDMAIKKYPDYGEAWYYKGNALIELGKYAEALNAFNESIRLDKSNAEAWYSRGDMIYVLATTKYGGSHAMLQEAMNSLNTSKELNPSLGPDVVGYINDKIIPKLSAGGSVSLAVPPSPATPANPDGEAGTPAVTPQPAKPSPFGDF